MPASNEINWPEINQARFHHTGGRRSLPFVIGPGVLKAFYRFDHLDKVSDDILPVILAEVNGKTFVLDGAHRLAKWILLKRSTILVVRLNAAESKSCIRPGMEAMVAALKLE